MRMLLFSSFCQLLVHHFLILSDLIRFLSVFSNNNEPGWELIVFLGIFMMV